MNTKNEQTRQDVTALLKARTALLWVVTREELRVERAITEAAGAAKYKTVFWDCVTGVTTRDADSGNLVEFGIGQRGQDPNAMLQWMRDANDRFVMVLRDMHRWFDGVTLRALRNLARDLQDAPAGVQRSIVILTPSSEVPPELAGSAVVIDWPLPERPEIAGILDLSIANLRLRHPEVADKAVTPETREQAIDAAVGLSAEEAANCYSRSLVTVKRIDPAIVGAEKKRVIAREKVLTWYDPDPRGLDAIGGMDTLKDWLVQRRAAFSQRAREYGLRPPRGIFLVGPPGCGKSLTAKAVAAAWQMPLLRLDLGALRSKFVGESEGNIRRALATAEAVAPAVLWLDEIEKALAGATGPAGDGGVAADALGAVLSWMQERQGAVFMCATANDVQALPPELLRKGRFDELFFLDLPSPEERLAVLDVTLRQHGRALANLSSERTARMADADNALVSATEGFTGVEVASLVDEAMFAAFNAGERELDWLDLQIAAKSVSPLAKTAPEKIKAVREWAMSRGVRFANAKRPRLEVGAGRALDL